MTYRQAHRPHWDALVCRPDAQLKGGMHQFLSHSSSKRLTAIFKRQRKRIYIAKSTIKKTFAGFLDTLGIQLDSLYTATFPPKAVSLCSRTATRVESEVQEWILERIEARDC
ncbi:MULTISPECIES: hypothetical protein [Shewanella]|uniref:hypothetical protein n=1 Tax=Shewanella TaxID=22 RepID=UPI0011B21710|nr:MULTISPECIES: hypothetical protein [Shewanella]